MIRHRLSSKTCMLCSNEFESEKDKVILHKTRRYTHIVCSCCLYDYIYSHYQQIIRQLGNYIKPSVYITCSGSFYSKKRCNRCIKPVHLPSLLKNSNVCSDTKHLIQSIIYIHHNFNHIFFCKICNDIVNIEHTQSIKSNCPMCHTTFCTTCKCSPYHTNKSCIEHKMSQVKDIYIIESMSNNILKACPVCFQLIEKTSGCNKMICSNCDMKWCWLCKEINIGYDHFSSIETNTSTCRNKLWV